MFFKQQIKNPYKINLKLYLFLMFGSVIVMYYGYTLSIGKYEFIVEIIKNIGLGSFASTLVAFIIEMGNVKEKNKKANALYKSTYMELQFSILRYIKIWSEFCCVVDKSKDYRKVKMTWNKWYELSKQIYFKSRKKRKLEMIKFLKNDLLHHTLEDVNNSIKRILNQKYLLEINDLYNSDLDGILKDFEFEFRCAKQELEFEKNPDDLWKMFDALNEDFVNYIDKWKDIRFYNNLEFKAYSYFDGIEYIKAEVKTYKK